MKFLKNVGSFSEFHSETNLGSEEGCLHDKVKQVCTVPGYQAGNSKIQKIKSKIQHNFRKPIGRQYLMEYDLC